MSGGLLHKEGSLNNHNWLYGSAGITDLTIGNLGTLFNSWQSVAANVASESTGYVAGPDKHLCNRMELGIPQWY